MAPLGTPVVPEVYICPATSPGAGSKSEPGSSALSIQASKSCPTTTVLSTPPASPDTNSGPATRILAFGVFEDESRLAGGESPVDRDQDRPQLAHPQPQVEK